MPGRRTVWTSTIDRTAPAAGAVVESGSMENEAQYEGHDDISASAGGGALKDLLISPLDSRRLEEARVRGYGVRSLDLGSIPTIHGPTLYQLRALLFARSQITSLFVPALPDAEQVYNGVNMPSLERLVIRCRYAEHPDIIGALQAFADNPAHASVRTLGITDAYALPVSLGRLRRNIALRLFLRHISHFEISGRAVARRGESGTSRHLVRFIAAMPALRSLRYEGYVPGLPAFQAIRVVLAERLPDVPMLQQLSISQLSHDGGPPLEDAHLFKQLCAMTPERVDVRLSLGVALDAPQLSQLANGAKFIALELTLAPDAVRTLADIIRANRESLRELRITALPAAIGEETASMWRALAHAVSQAVGLDILHFTPMLPQRAPIDAPARVLDAVRGATEVVIHAPGCIDKAGARKMYLAALNSAERASRMSRLVLCVADAPVDEHLEAARLRLSRNIASVELGRSRPGDGDYSPVPLLDPKRAGRLWPLVFLLKPWVINSIIVSIIIVCLIFLTVVAFGIALALVRRFDKQ